MIVRPLKLLAAAVVPLLLIGCLLMPGKFTSSLDVARDGSFTFRYKGELIFASNRSMLDGPEQKPEFSARCQDDEGERRECTGEEVAEQRRTFEQEQKEKAARDAKERAEAAAFLGGIDPENEASMNEFAARLQREAGWKTVTHRGKGIFDVDYEISAKLDRDFVFPIFPRFNFIVPAVVITRRDDDAILIRAPGFGDGASSSGMAPPSTLGGGGSKAEGVFTLRTDAVVATNNSDEGATAEGGRQKVEWRVTPLSRTAPEALLRLGR